MALTFRTHVRESAGVVILDISGRIVLGDGAKDLSRKMAELLSAGHNKILLNLVEATYVDSSGLGELVSSYGSVTKAGGKIKLLNVQPRVADLLKMTKLHTLFETFSDESQAVGSFQENQTATSA
jgi:anti-sigma B factor antagonist